MIKHCRYCEQDKPSAHFSPHPHTTDRLSNKCKDCVSAYNKLRHAKKTREELDLLNAKRRANRNTWKTDRKKHFKRAYGITVENYETMLVNQNGVCKICNKPCKSGKSLAVDHCHETGKVRGLLCAKCNTNLGRIEAYLRDPEPWDNYLRGSTILNSAAPMELNLSTNKLPEQSEKSSANNSPLSEKLCSQQINDLIERYSEPEQARQFLINAGIIDANGDLMPPYQKPPEKTQGPLDEWRSEGRGALFF